jgi:hypothetical protein
MPDGTRRYEQSNNFPNELVDLIIAKDPQSGGQELLCIVHSPPDPFPTPSPTGLQSTVWFYCILIFEGAVEQYNYPSPGAQPAPASPDIYTFLTTGGSPGYATSAFYTTTAGWAVLTSANALHTSAAFDPWLAQQILAANTYLQNNGYALPFIEVAIEPPVRSVSFQLTNITAKQIRSGGASPKDTLYGEAAIAVDDNPPQTSTFYFGNKVQSGAVLGLGESQSGAGSGLVATGPQIAIPYQYAIRTPPVPIVDPRSSVSFSYMVVNDGTSANGSSTTAALLSLGKAATGLVGKAVTALAGYLGIPAVGAIAAQQINSLDTSLFIADGCNGLCALQTYFLSGAGIMALDYGTQNGVILTHTQEFNNTIFSDSLLGGASPYDRSGQDFLGAPLCSNPDYIVTSAIIEQDTEIPVPFGKPAASGKAKIVTASPAWPGGSVKPPLTVPVLNTIAGAPTGQTLQTFDTTPTALACCVVPLPTTQPMEQAMLFWPGNDANHAIYQSVSTDGVNWTPGQLAPVGGLQPPQTVGTTATALAACVYTLGKTLIYLFWIPTDGSNVIEFAVSVDGLSWLKGTANPANTSPQTPAVCVFAGKLFMYWTANDPNHALFGSAYTGTLEIGMPSSPTGGPPFPPGGLLSATAAGATPLGTTLNAPAACVFNNKMYLFWVNSGPTGATASLPANAILFSASSDGVSFPAAQRINTTDFSPAAISAVTFENQLFVFWTGNDAAHGIWYSSSWDGQTWAPGQLINTNDSTPLTPAVLVFQRLMTLFWKSNDTANKIFFSSSRPPVCIGAAA